MTKLIHDTMQSLGIAARAAARTLALASSTSKNRALSAMAALIRQEQSLIQRENAKDMTEAQRNGLSEALLDRLRLDKKRIEAMATALEAIAELPDPIGTILAKIERPNGLLIERICVPIGVIGVIYESRPQVTADAAGLCLKAGNAVILRGGSESFYSSQAIMASLRQGLLTANLPPNCIQMVPTSDREAVSVMLKMDQYIDVIVPRGGPALIERITDESGIPLFKHLAGICHTYIHTAANLDLARNVLLNAKMRRTGICGATEVLLIDQAIASAALPTIYQDLKRAGCTLRGDADVKKLLPEVEGVGPKDYDTEFLDAILAIKIVENLEAAIGHINLHSTHHTDAIITEDNAAAQKFFNEVDSAIVMHNTSTQFADGGEFGMGAEIGIATGKLHARGPVGVEQLTIFKYIVHGTGQIREG